MNIIVVLPSQHPDRALISDRLTKGKNTSVRGGEGGGGVIRSWFLPAFCGISKHGDIWLQIRLHSATFLLQMNNSSPKERWRDAWQGKEDQKTNPFARRVPEYVHDPSRKLLLDLGCGDGRDALFFADQGFDVTATDFSESGIEVLRSSNPHIDTRVEDIRHMVFDDASFDVIYAHLSLHYFDNATTSNVFRHIHRMLKPTGFFFVKCKSTDDPLFGKGEKVSENMYRLEYVRHFFTEEYLRENLEGFTILDLRKSTDAYNRPLAQ